MRRIGMMALVAAAVATSTGAAATAATGEETASLAPDSLVPSLGVEQAPDDVFPKDFPMTMQADFVAESSRFLGDSAYGTHWVAVHDEGDICLITELADSVTGYTTAGPLIGATCTPPFAFYAHGATLEVQGKPGNGAVAYLLPPDVDSSAVTSAVRRIQKDTTGEVSLSGRDSSPLIVVSSEMAEAAGGIKMGRDSGEFVLSPRPTKSG